MFNFLKSDILKILDVTQDERDALFSHKIYNSINNIDDLHIFMENHIFAVWDFMSILKTLQKKLTCTDVPWAPKGGGTPARLLNEIVTEEESDIDIYGDYRSHFEMYYQAMNEAGANTKKIESFLNNLHFGVSKSLDKSSSPLPAINFVKTTFSMLENAPIHVVASMFTFGREEVIPNMFRSIINKIDNDLKGRLKSFIHYLDRHIGVDEDEHGPAALKMVKVLCQNDETKWNEAAKAARMTMKARVVFWNEILVELKRA
ncbi:MAG: hypothetical protein CBE10_03140 [bacterium TMED250]|nr:MAG: hypothetical protein CBE10_03140 [bacterium TMED250]